MLSNRQIADVLTGVRAALAATIALIGWMYGDSALPIIVWVLILCWTTDVLDGAFARRQDPFSPSWLGEHDLEVDMTVSAGLLVYLYLAGFVSTPLALGYVAFWLIIFFYVGHHRTLGMLTQAPIYAWLIVTALLYAPLQGRWMIGWIILNIVLTYPRFPFLAVPEFFDGIKEIWVQIRRGDAG